jgi:hypothetical protein
MNKFRVSGFGFQVEPRNPKLKPAAGGLQEDLREEEGLISTVGTV